MAPPRASSAALILANLIPLAGVVFLDWRVLDVLLLYWAENVVIGVINLLRMAVAQGRRIFLMPFFAAHYGIFCFGHYMAVTGLFVDGDIDGVSLPEIWRRELWIGVVAIAVSHLLSFWLNFIGHGEYRRTNASALMHRPYGRIVTLHVGVISGGLLITVLRDPVWALVVLIAVKIAMDLRLHARERDILGPEVTTTIGDPV